MIPADAQIVSEDDVRGVGVDVETLSGEVDRRGTRVTIAIVDAARRNPSERRFCRSFAGLAGLNTPGSPARPSAVSRDLLWLPAVPRTGRCRIGIGAW